MSNKAQKDQHCMSDPEILQVQQLCNNARGTTRSTAILAFRNTATLAAEAFASTLFAFAANEQHLHSAGICALLQLRLRWRATEHAVLNSWPSRLFACVLFKLKLEIATPLCGFLLCDILADRSPQALILLASSEATALSAHQQVNRLSPDICLHSISFPLLVLLPTPCGLTHQRLDIVTFFTVIKAQQLHGRQPAAFCAFRTGLWTTKYTGGGQHAYPHNAPSRA